MISDASNVHSRKVAQRLPPWIRVRLRVDGNFSKVHATLRAGGLHTVCEGAHCPNKLECYNRGTATVMILGDTCTRCCKFCAVRGGVPPHPADPREPERVVAMARTLGLRYVVVTSVTRDDLADGGAGLFAETIIQLKRLEGVMVEVLTPDFQGKRHLVETVLAAGPHVFNHNLETVRRLQPDVRPQADYDRSLQVLRIAAAWRPKLIVKSGLMVGLGETDDELMVALADLRSADCRSLTLGQYLAPSPRHWPIARFVPPEQFEHYRRHALAMGFLAVAAGPLVRSSYQADKLMATHQKNSKFQAPNSNKKQSTKSN
ncbi:MAG: lipoyl synthase [Kiritimatiellae bacterium]|nr:lipoyl synthase [Verrucomicrobiota bacterium]MCG2661671.1 lipoyl synthase [Kiritimatiellia bacterium]